MPQTIKFNSGSTSPLWNRRVGLSSSAASGALTASVAPNETWGTAGAGTLGITIVGGRSNRQCAPDSVRFAPDLSATTFDTAARWEHPGGDFHGAGTQGDLAHPGYDARLHDIIYFWDFGEDKTYTKTTNVLSHWQNARTAQGPFVSHVYTTPGTYTVGLTAVELSSGKIATAEEEVTIADPDVVYAGAKTTYVYPDGGSADQGGTFTIPTGSRTVAASNFQTDRDSLSESVEMRWLFQRGADYQSASIGTIYIDTITNGRHGSPDIYFGAYGTGARPIIGPAFKQFSMSNYGESGMEDFRVVGLDLFGRFDPATTDWGAENQESAAAGVSGVGNYVFAGGGDVSADIVVSDCIIRGWYFMVLNDQNSDDWDAHWHFHDCTIEDNRGGRGYLMLTSQRLNENTSFSMTGCSVKASHLTPTNDGVHEAVLRLESWKRTYLAKNEFHTPSTTNALVKIENTPVDFSGFDLTNSTTAENSGPWIHGRIFNIWSNSFEGQATMMAINRTMKQGGGANNGIIDGNIWVAGPSTIDFIQTGGQGYTIRNNLMWVPGKPTLHGKNLDEFFDFDRFTYDRTTYEYNLTLDSGETNDGVGNFWVWEGRPFPGMAPIRVYNNTLAFMRSTSQNGGNDPSPQTVYSFELGGVGDGAWDNLEAVFFESNIYHAPNLNTPVTVSGLDTSTNLPFNPFFRGPTYWDNSTDTLTAPVEGNAYAIDGENIPTFAAPATPLGTSTTDVTAPSVPLGVVWVYSSPDASVDAADARQPGAWLNGASPT